MFFTDSLLSVLDRALMVIICAVLLWGGITGSEFRIEWFVYAQTVAYLITAIVAMIVVIRKAKFRKLSWNWPFFLVILKKSFPFAVLVMLMAIYNRVDSVFIERLLGGEEGKRQSGIYAQAFRLLDAVNQFAWLTAVLLLPIYARMIKMKQDLAKMVRLPFALLFTSAIIAATGSFFYRFEIMQWLYPQGELETSAEFADKLTQSAHVYGILMFGFLGSTAMYVFSTLLTANGNLKQLNLIAFAGILINFAVNFLLVPRLQAVGAAYASLATQLFTAGAYFIQARNVFRFRTDYRFILSLLLFTLLVIGFNLLSKELSYRWQVSFLIMLTAAMIAAFVLKLINIPEMIRLLKEKSAE
jgi:O-antigen/teichoic acid export membrane protein